MKNFKKLLALAATAYAAAVCPSSSTTLGVDHVSYVRLPDHYNNQWLMMGGKNSVMSENMQREDQFGGCLSVTSGWEQNLRSDRGSESLAKAFGLDGKREVVFGAEVKGNTVDVRKFIHMAYPAGAGTATTESPFHNVAGTAKGTLGLKTMSLKAEHRRAFVDVAYCQDLGNFYEGLRFGITTAVVNMKNKLGATFAGTDPKAVDASNGNNGGTNTNAALTTASSEKMWNGLTVQEFFKGADRANDDYNAQNGLVHGKIASCDESRTSLSDIRACLDLEVLDNENAKVCVALEGVAPGCWGDDSKKGLTLFEPKPENRHFKLGARVDASACLAEGSDYSACVALQGLWHYSFPRDSVRLPFSTSEGYGHYALGYVASDVKTDGTLKALTPIIDIFMKANPCIRVKPESQLLFGSNLAFEKGCLCLDLSYQFHWMGEEKNETHKSLDAYVAHHDNAYNAANRAENTNATTWGLPTAPTTTNSVKFDDSTLKTSTESAAYHNLMASVAFMCKEWQYPASFAVQGGYRFAHNRHRNAEVWKLGFKGCVCF